MTFREKYLSVKTWQEKATIMNFYHVSQKLTQPKWRLENTATYFNCSIGLVSENIKLAGRIEELKSCLTRNDALIKIKGNE